MSVKARDKTSPELGQSRSTNTIGKVIASYPRFPSSFAERKLVLILGDMASLALTVCASFLLWRSAQPAGSGGELSMTLDRYWLLVLPAGWCIVARLMDLYHLPFACDRRTVALQMALLGAAALAARLAGFSLIPDNPDRVLFFNTMLIGWLVILAWRGAYAAILSPSFPPHRILIVGTGTRAQYVTSLLEESPNLNCVIAGHCRGSGPAPLPSGPSARTGNRPRDLADLAQRLQVHQIIVAVDGAIENALFLQLAECQTNGIQVSLMPDFLEQIFQKIPIEHIEPNWAMQVLQGRPAFNRFQLGLKRLLDLVLALLGLVVLLACLPFVAIAIRLDSAGPVLYRQTRCGRSGKPFSIVKFRTMIQDAERDGKPRWAAADDARITSVGHLLRKTYLDELPQVVNVLRGEMSIVGPRPERPEFVQQLQREIPFYRTRLMVKPGLTGWAQTQYRYGNSADDALIKLQYDFYYLRNWSIWLDLRIILQTFGAVLTSKGT